MDLDEWELLPDDGFLEIHDDGGSKILSRKYGGDHHPKTVFKTNYFICPSPKSPRIADPPASDLRPRVVLPNQLVPVPIDHEYDELAKQVTDKVIADQKITVEETGVDQDTVSQQVFFKKMKENEFVDMKVDSPKSSGRGIVPGTFQFEERSSDHQAYKGEAAMEAGKPGSKIMIEKEKNGVSKKAHQLLDSETAEEKEVEKNGGLNIWRWSLTGIGAICSFGVAAATICTIILGSHKQQHQHNQKLRFQIYADDKRIKQVVHNATKLNEAISAVRGVSMPLTRAHITIGGYYDGL